MVSSPVPLPVAIVTWAKKRCGERSQRAMPDADRCGQNVAAVHIGDRRAGQGQRAVLIDVDRGTGDGDHRRMIDCPNRHGRCRAGEIVRAAPIIDLEAEGPIRRARIDRRVVKLDQLQGGLIVRQ